MTTVDNKPGDTTLSIEGVKPQLKIPPFWNARPELWFIQVETQFRLNGVSSSNTKFDYLVSVLPTEVMELVADIILKPPDSEKYEFLKKHVLNRSTASEEKRLDDILNKTELGDSKPSELYRRMESLATNNSLMNEKLLKKLWLNKLPINIQTCLIAIEDKHDLNELFCIADKIYDTSNSTSSNLASITKQDNEDFKYSIQALENRLKRLETSQPPNFRRKYPPARSRNRSRSRSSTVEGKNLCWYHRRFGNKATKCRPPCSKNQQNSAKN